VALAPRLEHALFALELAVRVVERRLGLHLLDAQLGDFALALDVFLADLRRGQLRARQHERTWLLTVQQAPDQRSRESAHLDGPGPQLARRLRVRAYVGQRGEAHGGQGAQRQRCLCDLQFHTPSGRDLLLKHRQRHCALRLGLPAQGLLESSAGKVCAKALELQERVREMPVVRVGPSHDGDP
jgi:hypothetical protein